MLRASNLRHFALLTGLACGACAGSSPTQEPAAQSGGNEEQPDPTDVASPGDLPSEPLDNGPGGDPCCAAGPLVVVPSASDVCSFRAQEDRVVFHHRDDEGGVCVDLILVRLGEGGIAPEGMRLPFDWGVGHASSYPCTPDGELVSGKSATPLGQITGTIGMGGGFQSLPASVRLEVSLSAPASEGSEVPEYYSFTGGVNVSATCDASAPWANQPLNLLVEAYPDSLQGCTSSSALNRVRVHQYEPTRGTCTDLTLVEDAELGTLPPGLSLPEGWRVEEMYSNLCLPDQSAPSPQWGTGFTQATGSVSFRGDINGLPASVSVDVSMSTPPDDPAFATQSLGSLEPIDVTGGCTGTW